jgi:hypothetical protein
MALELSANRGSGKGNCVAAGGSSLQADLPGILVVHVHGQKRPDRSEHAEKMIGGHRLPDC